MRYEQYNDYKYRGYENIPNLNGMKMGIVLGIGIIKGWRVGPGRIRRVRVRVGISVPLAS